MAPDVEALRDRRGGPAKGGSKIPGKTELLSVVVWLPQEATRLAGIAGPTSAGKPYPCPIRALSTPMLTSPISPAIIQAPGRPQEPAPCSPTL
jgi:hypothetical protein